MCAIVIVVAGCATQKSPAPTGGAPNAAAAPAWLEELNRLRKTGGLKPVAEDVTLSRDCVAHAKYLVQQGPATAAQFEAYKSSLGLAAHHEDPASPHYSAAGAACTTGGEATPGFSRSNDVAFGRDPISDLDGLFYDAPFHRLSLLAPWATVAGYGSYGDFPRRAGTLALRGEGGIGSPLILFPTGGSVVPVGRVDTFEVPNPLTACPGYALPIGLPITIQLGSGYRGRLESYSVGGPSGAVETCGFDWLTYRNPDVSTQEQARKVLRAFGAIVLIPRHPMSAGVYKISVATGRQTFKWSFTVTTSSVEAGSWPSEHHGVRGNLTCRSSKPHPEGSLRPDVSVARKYSRDARKTQT
jgi:hypothetical protein